MKLTPITPPAPVIIPLAEGWTGYLEGRLDGRWATLIFKDVAPIAALTGTKLLATLPAGFRLRRRAMGTISRTNTMSLTQNVRVYGPEIHVSTVMGEVPAGATIGDQFSYYLP